MTGAARVLQFAHTAPAWEGMGSMVAPRFDVFDALCVLGRQLLWHPGEPETASDLLDEMNHCGVREALVLDCLAVEEHPHAGNRRVLDTTAGERRLHPAWTALPHRAPDEQPDGAAFVARMRKHGVGAAFLFPRQFNMPLSEWAVDAFLEPLAEARVPVFLNFGRAGREERPWDETDWDAVVGLCRRWPALPVIVTERRIRHANRTLYRALDACGNLRIETSGYWLYRGIEYLTERWGAERIIFGSSWPHLGYGPTLTAVTCADIGIEAKQKILGGNLRELLAWRGQSHAEPAEAPSVECDRYAAFAISGERPADMTFADCHGHLGGSSSLYHVPNGTIDETAAELERLGIEKAIVFSFGVLVSDERAGNDVIIEAVERYPGRFVGFAGLNPHRGEGEMLRELERCYHAGLRGIKLIPYYQGYPEEGPLIDAACRWAHEHRLIILNHHWGSPEQMTRLIETYPGACYFTGHATAAYADIMLRHANLYVCSCPLHRPRDCERLVAAIGADRLLFGSDLQDLPIAWGLGPILLARIPEEDKTKILGGNLLRILESGEYAV